VYIKSHKSNVVDVIDGLILKEREGEDGEGQQQNQLNTYTMFKYSIRTELTRKYYERRLRRFFNFILFEVEIKDIEKRCNAFAEMGRNNVNWTLNQVITFLHFQKERVEHKEITAATLKNFVKSLKVFCESAD
jgi:hypothetical protein